MENFLYGAIYNKPEEIVTGDIPIKITAPLTNVDDDTNIKVLLFQIKEALKRLEEKEQKNV